MFSDNNFYSLCLEEKDMEITKLDKIDFKGKSFVFDSSLSYFHCGSKWITRDEYLKLKCPYYDGYLSEYDKENPIVIKITEEGGLVRQKISGKTDYYVVGKSQDDSPSKNRDYQEQKSKGKPIVAISAENLKELLGIKDSSEDETKAENGKAYSDKYGMIQLYDPSGLEKPVVFPDNIDVEELVINGDDCKDWVYTEKKNNKAVYLTDYIGNADEITLPSLIDGKKVELTWTFAPGGCRFENCKAKKVSVPGSYKEIPPNFFAGNSELEEIIVGYGIEKIGFDFCAGAKRLNNICFPDSIKEVGFGCLGGTKWDKEQGSEAIAGSILIHKLGSKLHWSSDSVYCVPEGVTCIAEYAFSGDGEKNPYYIHSVELPESIKYISDQAFFSLPMDYLKAPTTIEHIGSRAFLGTRISNYYRDRMNEKMLIVGDILCEVFTGNCGKKLEVPEGVKRISDEAMQGNLSRPEEVILPESLEELGKNIQWGKPLKKVTIKDNLKSIGSSCFYGCEALTSIELPKNLEIIGDHAFMYTGQKEITIPGNVKTISHFAFGRCNDLETVVVCEGVETIDDSAFEECRSLKRVELPNTLKSIGYRAFALCDSLKSIIIPSSVEYIDPEAFTELENKKIEIIIKTL